MKKEYPSLSVVILSYNYERYIEKCLNSILEQNFQPKEIIIIDDCSTDNSRDILQKYQDNHSHIKLIFNPTNIGMLKVLENVNDKITGDYVYLHAIDDFIMPGFFERSMQMLTLHSTAALCTTDPIFFHEKENKYIYGQNPEFTLPLLIKPKEVVKYFKTTNFWIPTHATIFKTEVYKKFNYSLANFGLHADWLKSHAIAFRYDICYLPEHLATTRIHPTQYSQSFPLKQRQILWGNIFDFLLEKANKDLKKGFKNSLIFSHLVNDNYGYNPIQAKAFVKFFFKKFKYFQLFSFKILHKTKKMSRLHLKAIQQFKEPPCD